MAKLDDIPKKQFFDVPDGYFEDLPSRVQSKISTRGSEAGQRPFAQYALRLALPALLLAIVAIFYFRPTPPDMDSMLASAETEDLILYLQDAGMTTDEILEELDLSAEEVEALESAAYELDLEDIDLD